MYVIEFSDTARKEFKKLETEVQHRIIDSLERIKIRPQDYIERLVGYQYYKLRVGDYRLIMEVFWDRLYILIISVGHRKNIYKHNI